MKNQYEAPLFEEMAIEVGDIMETSPDGNGGLIEDEDGVWTPIV